MFYVYRISLATNDGENDDFDISPFILYAVDDEETEMIQHSFIATTSHRWIEVKDSELMTFVHQIENYANQKAELRDNHLATRREVELKVNI